MKKKQSAHSNTKIAIVFFIFLASIIVISLTLKVITVMKASQFDGSKRFTVTIANPKNIEVISLDPGSKNVAIFKLNGNMKSTDVGRLLEIPIDGFIADDSLDLNQKMSSLFFSLVFNYHKLATNLTIIDMLKLAMLTRSIPESSIVVREVEKMAELGADDPVGRLVIDSNIESERQTIQVINATQVGGLGGRLAKLLTHMGGNVIMVVTADSSIKQSKISFLDKKSYTVERLKKVLGYEAVQGVSSSIADITITIGEDGANSAPF